MPVCSHKSIIPCGKKAHFCISRSPRGDVKENYRFSILSLVCPPEPFFKCQPAQAISTWFILRINLKAPSGCCCFLVSSSCGQSHIFDPLFCFCPHLRWDPGPPRLLIPPHSHIWSFNVQLGPVLRVSSASPFSFTPQPPTSLQYPFNMPSFCFFPPPLLLLLLSLSLVQDQGLTAPVSGDRGRDHLVRGTSLQILPNSGRL